MANVVLTQDIPDIQVIVEHPLDPAGFFWHHRILLKKLAPGVWLCLTPDLEVSRHDLNTHNHIVLDRHAPFPRAQAAYVYAFDPVSKATLEAKKRAAMAQAVILGEEDLVELTQTVWVVAEKGHARFGEVVPSELIDDGNLTMVFESKGVSILDGEEVFVQRMQTSDLEQFKSGDSKDEGDLRLLGVHTDKTGKRKLDLADSISLMKEEQMEDFPLGGSVRAAMEFLTSVNDGPGSLARYHTEWQRLSGISENSSVTYSHRNLCEALRLMHSFDQINVVNTASGELLVRWIIQLETATERNPRSPDFSGLDIVMMGPTTSEGKAITSKFTEHLTAKLKERAAIWKQERLYREERRHVSKGSKGDTKGEGKGKDGPKGPKAKARPGAGGGKGNSPAASSE